MKKSRNKKRKNEGKRKPKQLRTQFNRKWKNDPWLTHIDDFCKFSLSALESVVNLQHVMLEGGYSFPDIFAMQREIGALDRINPREESRKSALNE